MPKGFTYNIIEVEKFATSEVYGKVLVSLSETNKNIVVLTADLMRSNKTGDFARAYPKLFFNFGIA